MAFNVYSLESRMARKESTMEEVSTLCPGKCEVGEGLGPKSEDGKDTITASPLTYRPANSFHSSGAMLISCLIIVLAIVPSPIFYPLPFSNNSPSIIILGLKKMGKIGYWGRKGKDRI